MDREEELSAALFLEANESEGLLVVSWQAVDGKGYFTADVKLRLPGGERMEPDLIVSTPTALWLVEVKALHGEALTDEWKLIRLRDELTDAEIQEQVTLRSGVDVAGLNLATAVAYVEDDVKDRSGCSTDVTHLCSQASDAAGQSRLRALWSLSAEE